MKQWRIFLVILTFVPFLSIDKKTNQLDKSKEEFCFGRYQKSKGDFHGSKFVSNQKDKKAKLGLKMNYTNTHKITSLPTKSYTNLVSNFDNLVIEILLTKCKYHRLLPKPSNYQS